MKTHAQTETQVHRGIWSMPGEEWVTARLGALSSSPQPIRIIRMTSLTTS